MESPPELPPKVPEDLAGLTRVVELLSALCQAGKIKESRRVELETLVGCRVTQQDAARWKKHLVEIRRDLAAELKQDPEG